jgi:hypothetical protein
MDRLGFNNNYDYFILAGGSLGLVQTNFTEWKQTALDHVGLAIQLHKIEQIIIIDHADCGAYKKLRPEILNMT